MQAIVTIIAGSVIGLSYAWQPALVGMGAMSFELHRTSAYIPYAACIPVLISTGYIRLVRNTIFASKFAEVLTY